MVYAIDTILCRIAVSWYTILGCTGISVYMCMSRPAGSLNFNTPFNLAGWTQCTSIWHPAVDRATNPDPPLLQSWVHITLFATILKHTDWRHMSRVQHAEQCVSIWYIVPVRRANALGFIALYLFSHSYRRESVGNILAHHLTDYITVGSYPSVSSQIPY